MVSPKKKRAPMSFALASGTCSVEAVRSPRSWRRKLEKQEDQQDQQAGPKTAALPRFVCLCVSMVGGVYGSSPMFGQFIDSSPAG